jgi:hypothetical protein
LIQVADLKGGSFVNITRKFILLLLISMPLLLSPDETFACSCIGFASVCQAYNSAQSIFVGTVAKVEDVAVLRTIKGIDALDLKSREVISTISGWKMYIKVEKTYKGEPQNEIILARENTSCGGKFDVGSKLLLYAYFNKELGMWEIPPCNRNVYVSDAGDDLRFLEELPGNLGRTRISGELVRYEETPDKGFSRTGALAGAKIEIAGNGMTVELRTDQNGLYEIYDLPSGEYTITPEIPQNLKIRFPIVVGSTRSSANRPASQNSVMINLKENSCVGVDFSFNANNRISGKLFGSTGEPMKDVCLDLVPLTDKISQDFRVYGCTKEDGSYVLKDMPAGRYLIQANSFGKVSSTAPFPPVYYPNTFEKEKASIIEMREGDIRENYDITIPAQSETITIQGVLLYLDGTPVVKEFVEFKADKTQPTIDGDSITQTDSQGHFTIRILKGLSGKLYGKMNAFIGEFENCPDLDRLISSTGRGMSEITTEAVATKADGDLQGIELNYKFPGCRKVPR